MKTPGSYSRPIEQLQLSGAIERNPARFANRLNTPTPTEEIGEPPAHLPEAQKAIWNEIACQCPPGVLFASDRIALELAVTLIEKMRAGKMNGAQTSVLLSTLQNLGMTPVSRSRITVAKPEEESIWDSIIGDASQAN